jgi:hypothetical protein
MNYELFTFQDSRYNQLEEKLRVTQLLKDEVQSRCNQQTSTVNDLQSRNSTFTLETETMKKRIEEMQQVSCTVVPPLIRPLPTKTTPLNMKKRMEEMQQVSCTVVPPLIRGVVFVGRGLIRGGTTVQLTCCISSILFFMFRGVVFVGSVL